MSAATRGDLAEELLDMAPDLTTSEALIAADDVHAITGSWRIQEATTTVLAIVLVHHGVPPRRVRWHRE